ncbi:MAG: HAD hydrolase family protein [Flavobacteriales bacterium]|nr:HAD hydrolase family protein [Flavobacteriales bacterium]
MTTYKQRLAQITTFCFDYDGVFTDGVMMLLSTGEIARTAHVRDGYAVQLAAKCGFNIAIITGGTQEAVRTRFEGLGVNHVYLGAKDKVDVFQSFLKEKNIDASEVLYMGDDIPDYRVLQLAGISTCPADAAPEIKSVSDYISPIGGGQGCVRDIIEQTLKAQGKWMQDNGHQW